MVLKKKVSVSLVVAILFATIFAWKISYNNQTLVVYRSPEFEKVVNQANGFVNIYDDNDNLIHEEIPHFTGAKVSHSWLGQKILLPLLKNRLTAKAFGWYKRSWLSRFGIEKYCQKHQIDLTEFEPSHLANFESYNHFFTRKLSPKGLANRQPENDCAAISSPADGKVFVLKDLDVRDHFWLKESDFDLKTFVGDAALAKEFDGGSMLIFRLAPHDYHRFHAPMDFEIINKYKLGVDLESVNPYAYAKERKPLIKNKRWIIIANNEQLGKFIIAPVGAMIVGSIKLHPKYSFTKGDELGWFEFGGSTVVILFAKGQVELNARLLKNSTTGFETKTLTGRTVAKILAKK